MQAFSKLVIETEGKGSGGFSVENYLSPFFDFEFLKSRPFIEQKLPTVKVPDKLLRFVLFLKFLYFNETNYKRICYFNGCLQSSVS